MNELKFALYTLKKNMESSAELRTSFIVNIIGMALNNIAFIIVWVYFVRSVGVIGGWREIDIVALQGFSALTFGLAFFVGNGIRRLPDYVASGAFDRFMLYPKNLLLRVLNSDFNTSTLGDILFGIVCLIVYGFMINIGFYQVLIMFFLVLIATIIFMSVAITINSLSFYFTDSASITSGVFELFFSPSLFSGGAFQGKTRFFFTFIIPSLLIATIPVEAVRDVSIPKIVLLVLFAILWVLIATRVFHKAVKKYESANFMTFGS